MPRTFTFGPNSNAVSNSPDDDSNNNEFAEALAQMEKQAAAGGAPPADNVASSITTTAASSGNAASNDEPKLAEAEKPATATVGDPALQHQIHALQAELLAAKKRTEQDFLTYEEHARHEAVMAARMKLVLPPPSPLLSGSSALLLLLMRRDGVMAVQCGSASSP